MDYDEKNISFSHPHNVRCLVRHICNQCELKCAKEDKNEFSLNCEKAKYEPQIVARLGDEVHINCPQ